MNCECVRKELNTARDENYALKLKLNDLDTIDNTPNNSTTAWSVVASKGLKGKNPGAKNPSMPQSQSQSGIPRKH